MVLFDLHSTRRGRNTVHPHARTGRSHHAQVSALRGRVSFQLQGQTGGGQVELPVRALPDRRGLFPASVRWPAPCAKSRERVGDVEQEHDHGQRHADSMQSVEQFLIAFIGRTVGGRYDNVANDGKHRGCTGDGVLTD